MKYIYILLIVFSISFASEISLKEFQSGKIKQTSGDVYSYFVPRNNISIRQEKSLSSSKVGKLELTNYLDYDIIDEDEEWLSIYSNGTLLGYSKKYIELDNDKVKNLFDKCLYIKKISEINLGGSSVKLNLIQVINGLIHKDGRSHDMKGKYYYEVLTNDGNQQNILLNNGNAKTVYKKYIDKNYNSESDLREINLYSLNLNNNLIGWMIASNKWENTNYYQNLDFSNSRIMIPRLISGEINLYNKQTGGLSFTDVGNFLDINNNEIDIIWMKTASHWSFANAWTGNYYIPRKLNISIDEDDNIYIDNGKKSMYVSSYSGDTTYTDLGLDIKITENLIKSNPEYIFSIAYLMNDKESMDKAYHYFKSDLEFFEKKCDKYYKNMQEFIDGDTLRLDQYWGSFLQNDEYSMDENGWRPSQFSGVVVIANDYLQECSKTDINLYNIFFRTGLYPSPSFIEKYINSDLIASPKW